MIIDKYAKRLHNDTDINNKYMPSSLMDRSPALQKQCPNCGAFMLIRENSITFWEKSADKPAYRCSNTNCLHKITLDDDEAELYVLEQRLADWAISKEHAEEYELQELMQCLRKTLRHLQSTQNPTTSAKSYFLQELKKQGRTQLNIQQLLGTIIPLVALGLTLIAIILLGPKVGELLKASLLSLPH